MKTANWADKAIGYLLCDSNDLQHSEQKTALFSSVYRVGYDGGIYVIQENLWQVAIVFSIRRLVKPTWLNDRDQFFKPIKPLTQAFITDCLIWMLFNRTQRTASTDNLEWGGEKWSLVNHFIPYTEIELNAPDRFESDFMAQYIADKEFSQEAQQVLSAGRELWKTYFSKTDVRTVRDEFALNRPDVGWYQVRKALQARNASGDFPITSFKPFESAYKTLTEKLQPQVYEYGFLKG